MKKRKSAEIKSIYSRYFLVGDDNIIMALSAGMRGWLPEEASWEMALIRDGVCILRFFKSPYTWNGEQTRACHFPSLSGPSSGDPGRL